MTFINASLRAEVVARADGCCEYCRMPGEFERTTFQIDHVVPEKLGGPTESANLAFACFRCNNAKGPNIAGIDPDTGLREFLFDPRSDRWTGHFEWRDELILGRTAKGRTTIAVLRINTTDRQSQRRQLIREGVFPPL